MTALDAIGPYEVLSRLPGAEVVFAGHRAGPVRTDTGHLRLVAAEALDGIAAPPFDAGSPRTAPAEVTAFLRANEALVIRK
jgi:putative intracellular protease/amidase